MRSSALLLASFVAVAACGTEENTVLSGYPPAVISPVRSSIAAQVTFTDGNGSHPQWIVAMSDVPDLCAKVTAHHDYFQNPIESFTVVVVWVPPGNIGTFFVGQGDPLNRGSTTNNEVLMGSGPGTGSAHVVRLPGVVFPGANIGLSQFDVGGGGEARGSFDVVISDPGGNPHEYVGRFKATYCPGAEPAALP
ncbi:MAG: hypothetical protein ACJ79H_10425 [Myxococcales bacterium]